MTLSLEAAVVPVSRERTVQKVRSLYAQMNRGVHLTSLLTCMNATCVSYCMNATCVSY